LLPRTTRTPLDAQRLGTGLALILFPLVFVVAFAVHPDLLSPRLLAPTELIQRAHGNSTLQFAHALVTLNTGLLVVAALHFKAELDRRGASGHGLVGACLAIAGALALAAEKGALCLTMSAIDTLPERDFLAAAPALDAIFAKQGWLVLTWGIVLLPIGFAILAAGLLRRRIVPRWQAVLFLIGVTLIATPDGLEIINLSAATVMAIATLPLGWHLLRRPKPRTAPATT
jgi:hypothetical protein